MDRIAFWPLGVPFLEGGAVRAVWLSRAGVPNIRVWMTRMINISLYRTSIRLPAFLSAERTATLRLGDRGTIGCLAS